MRVGVLVTGDIAVRAAHTLAAHPTVDDVVVIGPARSRHFRVVDTAEGCDLLVGTGGSALKKARQHDVPLLWDGDEALDGVSVYGANPQGLTLALAAREDDPRLVAVAHPAIEPGSDQSVRFPDPIGKLSVSDGAYLGHRLAQAKSPNEFAACLAVGAERRVTIVDHGAFMSGIALAAAVDIANGSKSPVWDNALPYLKTVTSMGLVMAEDV